jgi:hypothetical protein
MNEVEFNGVTWEAKEGQVDLHLSFLSPPGWHEVELDEVVRVVQAPVLPWWAPLGKLVSWTS